MYRKLMAALFLAAALVVGGMITGGALSGVAAQPAALSAEQEDSLANAVAWLTTNQQNEDGGYGIDFNTGEPLSNVPGTVDALLAITAAGYYVDVVSAEQRQAPLDYLLANLDDVVAYAGASGGANGKLILALAAAGYDPRNFGDHDFVAGLTEQLDPATGQYNSQAPFEQALALLGLAAAGEPAAASGLDWLISQQATEGTLAGSWEDGFGTEGNPDATAVSLMALLANGRPADDPVVRSGFDFLAANQHADGGWEYGPGFGPNANSTAVVIQALSAAGEDYRAGEGRWAVNGRSPLDALLAWQSDSGAFQADFGDGPFDDFFSTVQAIPAVAGQPLPFVPPPAADIDVPVGGDSILPYVLVVLTILLVAVAAWWMFAGKRRA